MKSLSDFSPQMIVAKNLRMRLFKLINIQFLYFVIYFRLLLMQTMAIILLRWIQLGTNQRRHQIDLHSILQNPSPSFDFQTGWSISLLSDENRWTSFYLPWFGCKCLQNKIIPHIFQCIRFFRHLIFKNLNSSFSNWFISKVFFWSLSQDKIQNRAKSIQHFNTLEIGLWSIWFKWHFIIFLNLEFKSGRLWGQFLT